MTFGTELTRKGWCPRTGKGQRFMSKEVVNGNISSYWVWKRLMSQLRWQHAKIISPNKNPPQAKQGGYQCQKLSP